MATTQYTYAQTASGFHGALSTQIINANRVYGAGARAFFSAKVIGSEFKIRDTRGDARLWEASVDGGAYVATPLTSGVITLFTGLADVEHDVTIRLGGVFGETFGWWPTDGTYLFEVTGVAPNLEVLTDSYNFYNDSAVASGVFATVANYDNALIPSSPFPQYTSKCSLRTSATEVLVTITGDATGTPNLYYTIDGVRQTIVTGDASRVFRLTGLSGEHTYNFWAGKDLVSPQESGIGSICLNAPYTKVGYKIHQFGDSITAGETAASCQADVEYHQVAAHFGALGHGWAIGGWTIQNVIDNLASLKVADIFEIDDVAIIAVGRNDTDLDTNPAKAVQYSQLITDILAIGFTKVLCRGLPPIGGSSASLNVVIEGVVTDYADSRVQYIPVEDWTGIDTPDNVHPSPAGYQQMVEYAKVTYEPFLVEQAGNTASISFTLPALTVSGIASTEALVQPIANCAFNLPAISVLGSITVSGITIIIDSKTNIIYY